MAFNLGAFAAGFAGGMKMGKQWKDWQEEEALKKDLAGINSTQPQEQVSAQFTEKDAPAGYVYDSDTGQYIKSGGGSYEEATGLRPQFDATVKTKYAAFGQEFDTKPSAEQLQDLRAQARADVYRKYGRDEEADAIETRGLQRKAARQTLDRGALEMEELRLNKEFHDARRSVALGNWQAGFDFYNRRFPDGMKAIGTLGEDGRIHAEHYGPDGQVRARFAFKDPREMADWMDQAWTPEAARKGAELRLKEREVGVRENEAQSNAAYRTGILKHYDNQLSETTRHNQVMEGLQRARGAGGEVRMTPEQQQRLSELDRAFVTTQDPRERARIAQEFHLLQNEIAIANKRFPSLGGLTKGADAPGRFDKLRAGVDARLAKGEIDAKGYEAEMAYINSLERQAAGMSPQSGLDKIPPKAAPAPVRDAGLMSNPSPVVRRGPPRVQLVSVPDGRGGYLTVPQEMEEVIDVATGEVSLRPARRSLSSWLPQ